LFNLGARWGPVVNATPQSLYPSGKGPVPIVQEDGWDPGPVWTGAENLAPTEIRSPDLVLVNMLRTLGSIKCEVVLEEELAVRFLKRVLLHAVGY
jgi:hypothetical protein